MKNDDLAANPPENGEEEIETVLCIDLTREKGLIGWYMRVYLSLDEEFGMIPWLEQRDLAGKVALLFRCTLAFAVAGWSLHFLGLMSGILYLYLAIALMAADMVVVFMSLSRFRAILADVRENHIFEYKRIEASSIVLSIIICIALSILLFASLEPPENPPYEQMKIQSAPQEYE